MKRTLTALVAFSVFAVGMVASAAPASAASQSHTGQKMATHMEVKDSSGNIVCSAYNTKSSARPVARYCPDGNFTEQLFDSNWRQIGQRKVEIGSPNTLVTVDPGEPAAHMELKDGRRIVCSAYNTNPNTAPTAQCPLGGYYVYLFDSDWNQIGEPSLVVLRERP